MSERNSQQGSLFEIQESIVPPATTEPSSYVPRREVSFSCPNETADDSSRAEEMTEIVGTSVDILDRNSTLAKAIGIIASISRAEGLKKANEIPSERNRLQDRYGERHQEVVDNATDKSMRDATAVPEEFAKAWGLDQVMSSGLLPKLEAEAAMAKDYRKFEAWYGGPRAGAKRRQAKRSWLNYQKRALRGQQTRKPKADYPRHPSSM